MARLSDHEMTDGGQHGSTPRPDPTVLTTQQLNREILAVREIIDTRIAAMDKAVELLHTQRDSSIASAINALQALHEEKFASIQTQFKERDTRTEQTSKDSKVAVDAALQAAKEAVGEQNKSSALAIAKSETSTTKQIDAIGIMISTMTKATDDKIDDLKTRLTLVEGHTNGAKDLWGYIIGVGGFVVAIVAVMITMLRH